MTITHETTPDQDLGIAAANINSNRGGIQPTDQVFAESMVADLFDGLAKQNKEVRIGQVKASLEEATKDQLDQVEAILRG